MGWQPEHTASLLNLIDNGITYSDAARVLNDKYGTSYSRDACIGRAYRVSGQKPKKRGPRLAPEERQKLKTLRRKEKRWAANPSLAERARLAEQRKAIRAQFLDRGTTKTSPAYRKHMPRQREMSKTELRTMLETAFKNTADMGTPA